MRTSPLSSTLPLYQVAGEREDGCPCARCGDAVRRSETVAVCPVCAGLHHTSCWDQQGGCGSYTCAPARIEVPSNGTPVLRISATELERAAPLPPRRPVFATLSAPAT